MSKSIDDRRRERELEEARKAGTVPAERDADGNEINPHIPQYMSQAPWYLNAEGPGLQHQKNLKGKKPVATVSDFIPRGQLAGPAATKFRKGACTNCGAMTHAAKDCVERPRKKGAKFTGTDIKADEAVVEMVFDYAGKRDHWAQYDPSDHTLMIEAHEKEMEVRIKQHKQTQVGQLAAKEKEREERRAERRRKRQAKKAADGGEGGGGADDDEEGEEGEGSDTDADTDDEAAGLDDPEGKLAESEQLNVGTKMNANKNGGAKMTVRNLRIREDTAKYLLNLDVNSAFYDPKTHSMRENPLPGTAHDFVPYNEERRSGQARELAALQLYELEASSKGSSIHLNADPTSIELMNKIYREKKAKLQETKVNRVLEKYGGAEHLEKPPDELLFAQTEEYTEYTRSGALKHGREKAIVRSKYEEDVHVFNHMAVSLAGSSSSALPQSAMFGTGEDLADAPLDGAKMQAAIATERVRQRESVLDERKRRYNSMTSVETTAEEMEAYHRIKQRSDDPMAAMLTAGAAEAATDDEA
ncbi:pre-mRNA-splicing factor slu7 [Chrysochromulina tobinii]|uniref:Pre-mRNA-splicing factor SLU7 n=1 Tax=Chrysochromulina tobinii TaxID=1460289 RepID=A0A0M0J9V0_9EUKA|nr:pre-mRNA-splicing factor slu7 [Chrysochromulina tobinii]|eukprot:KOO23351.1 pre-mRNA-splicing factor slu7 [Chrysochromulina sp. CCMP291]